MIDSYTRHYKIPLAENLHSEAIAWAAGRGSRSGRVAWQFVTAMAAKHNIKLN